MDNGFTIHDIESLTAGEIKTILALNEIRLEAAADSAFIHSVMTFKIGEKRKTVWEDSHNAEYLTYEGVWQARYLHQAYDVDCSAVGIFNAYKEAYFDKGTTAAGYFRSWVARLREQYATGSNA